ncbi:hypothetical protein LCGC14_2059130, partial [marine sediment metagenome]
TDPLLVSSEGAAAAYRSVGPALFECTDRDEQHLGVWDRRSDFEEALEVLVRRRALVIGCGGWASKEVRVILGPPPALGTRPHGRP